MKTVLTLIMVAALSACASSNPDVIQRRDTQRMSLVEDATVLSARPVTVEGSQSGVGTLAGGVVGGVAGSSVGGHRESIVGTVLGAVIGGVIGNAAERAGTKENAVEILVQMRNGDRRAIVQASASEIWQPGDPVVLVTSGGRTRVTHAPIAAPQTMPMSGPVPKS